MIYSSDIQYLNPKDKGFVKVNFENKDFNISDKTFFVLIQLVKYLDENDHEIIVLNEEATKVKFQFSNELNYFGKYQDMYSKKISECFYNINARIKYDFEYAFFKKTHKSNLVAPAFLLEIEKQ